MKDALLVLISSFLLAVISFSQESSKVENKNIGPATLNELPEVSIYIFRREDEMPNYYYGLAMENENGIYARIRSMESYHIHTHMSGATKLFFTNLGNTHEQQVDLNPGKRYYFELKVKKVASGTAALSFVVSDSTAFYSFLTESGKELNHCYSRIASSSSEYISSFALKDSLLWPYDVNRSFSTIIPECTDVFNWGESPSLSFYNPYSSFTFSESVYLVKKKKAKFKSGEDFKSYMKDDFVKSLDGIILFSKEVKQDYKVISDGVIPFSAYSSLVYFEFKDYNAANKGANDFLLIKAYAVVFVVDHSDGNQYLYYLALSERGVETELYSEKELLETFTSIYKSLQIKNVPFELMLKK